jgi:hypothetical protein
VSPESPKRVWWKIALGAGLIIVEINSQVNPAPNLLKANNATEQAGMYFAMTAIIVLGVWLIYSGYKPRLRKPS